MPTALLSVYHKTGIITFAEALRAQGWDLLASGGTAKALSAAGLPVRDVADVVGEPILGHRVVTLSREIHAGLLARPKEDAEEMARLGLPYIDLVCVDFYPLREAILAPGASPEKVKEMTDIGGPALLRSAAKGQRIVIARPEDRVRVLQWLHTGQPDKDSFLQDLAATAELVVAQYCVESAKFLSGGRYEGLFFDTGSPVS